MSKCKEVQKLRMFLQKNVDRVSCAIYITRKLFYNKLKLPGGLHVSSSRYIFQATINLIYHIQFIVIYFPDKNRVHYSLFKIRFRRCSPYLFVIKSCTIRFISKILIKGRVKSDNFLLQTNKVSIDFYPQNAQGA